MTDLERDLKELLHERADHLDSATLAPSSVLKRGRRRQVGTVALTAGGLVAAVVLAVVAIGSLRGTGTGTVPADPGNGLPARTITVQGIEVTAPTGWYLQDLSPWAQAMITEQRVCSFEATGQPVGATGAGSDAVPSASGPTDCTTSPVALPAGVPVLQIANFDPGLASTVCGLADQRPTRLPDDGVALYVAEMPPGSSADELGTTCPGYVDMAVATAEHRYAAVVVAGPNATTDDVQRMRDELDAFPGSDIQPTTPAAPGSGYVLAAGTEGDTSWRLEAGVNLTCESAGRCIGQFALVTTASDGTEVSEPVPLPTDSDPIVAQSHALSGVVQLVWGTSMPGISDLAVITPDGSPDALDPHAWPAGITDQIFDVPGLSGTIWWTVQDGQVQVRGTLDDGSTYATVPGQVGGTITPPSSQGSGQQLDVRVDGAATVATISAFGKDWEIRAEDGHVGIVGEPVVLTDAPGAGIIDDVDGGSFYLKLERPSIGSVIGVTDEGERIEGRWMPVTTPDGSTLRLWVLPLPGAGHGTVQTGNGLPIATQWPTRPAGSSLHPGDMVFAGSDGNVSYEVLVFTENGSMCLVTREVAGDDAMVGPPCDRPPADGTGTIVGLAGDRWGLLTLLGPAGMDVHLTETGTSSELHPLCAGAGPESATPVLGGAVCVVPVSLDVPVTLRWTAADGTPIEGGPVAVTVRSDGTTSLTDPPK